MGVPRSIRLALLPLLSFLSPALGAPCQPGIILPVWMPQEDLSTLEIVGRGILYFLAMIYLFIGVSIVSDRFMGAIEVITSKHRKIKIKTKDGSSHTVVVRIWNQTVANLTLMALGSSAPEILLSVIEVIGRDFTAGELGPSTIVGSAAFNFFVIIGICMVAIPTGQVRRIKDLKVFFVTATWSLFAYIWLLIILQLSSPGVIEIWEGAVTLVFFFVTVLTAWIADALKIDKFRKIYRLDKRGVIVQGEANTELGMLSPEAPPEVDDAEMSEEFIGFEKNRADTISLLQELRRRYPNSGPEFLETMARKELFAKEPKSRAFYRIQATRNLVGGRDLWKKLEAEPNDSRYTLLPSSDVDHPDQDHVTRIYFNPATYAVKENAGTVDVTVCRAGGHLNETVMVDYETEDGTATAGEDYVAIRGTLTFGPEVTKMEIQVEIIDDDVFELDEHFHIRLKNARFEHGGQRLGLRRGLVKTDIPFRATVTILDDDHAGYFNVAQSEMETMEGIGTFDVKVTRASGARGKVLVPYFTVDGTAKSGKDFQHVAGELKFEDNETEKVVKIEILDENSYEKDVSFYLQLSAPISLDAKDNKLVFREKVDGMSPAELIASAGWPKLGSVDKGQIRIKESSGFKGTVDMLLTKESGAVVVGTTSWKEQFVDAVTVNSSREGDEGGTRPTCGDYLMHVITVFWKVLFAFIPPTSILDGYLTFIVSIMVIGVLTAFIGDIASHLGCTIMLEDSVTAIAIIALGTSVPDAFASRVAAVQDASADAAIVNVTGSNAVNVFLGLGIAWTLAAIVKATRTCTPELPDCDVFKVPPGNLGFSVALFCAFAVVGIILMLIRRLPAFGGGELGGPAKSRYPIAIFFIFLWLLYVVISTLEVYKVIDGF